jgi:site-specific recombinase XerD
MSAVHRITRPARGPTVGEAVAAYLATLDHPESAGTRRVYAATLRALRTAFDAQTPLVVLAEPAQVQTLTVWFEQSWGHKAAATYNRNLDALRSALHYWSDQDWIHGDPTRSLRRRGRAPDRSKGLARELVDQLLTRDDLALRERVLWRMLYETAARAREILALDIDDLDRRNRSAKVRRKGGAVDTVIWQTGTARLLPRLIGTRTSGPLFLTDRAARVQLPPADLDPSSGRARLSYRRAAELFEHATTGIPSGPWTLHQLRHSALTHAAEDGANTATLLAYSGHTSVTSLARYTRLSPEALSRWQQTRDTARRR